MKKRIALLLLLTCIGTTACQNQDVSSTNTPTPISQTSIETPSANPEATPTEISQVSPSADPQTDNKENASDTEKAPEDTVAVATHDIEAELVELEKKEQAFYDEMNAKEFISQLDMNLTSENVYKLWDDELNTIWALLQETLSETDFETLKNEQLEWIKEKEARLDELREIETGSAGPTIINGEASDMTKKRIYELVPYLAKH